MRLLVAPLHVRVEIRAPGHIHPLRPRVRFHHERVFQRLGLEMGEEGEPQHQRRLTPGASPGIVPPGTAFPSPPGHTMSGNAAGPNRGASPFSLRRSALNTFSGVIGTSSMRTPTASYTAFATAGGTGSSGPWPHSLAPKGPLGSGSSTT